MITLDNWRERMRADLRLRDYRQRTQSAYDLATEIYLHVTQPGVERVQDVLDRLMVDL